MRLTALRQTESSFGAGPPFLAHFNGGGKELIPYHVKGALAPQAQSGKRAGLELILGKQNGEGGDN